MAAFLDLLFKRYEERAPDLAGRCHVIIGG